MILFEFKVLAFLSIAISAGVLATQQKAKNIYLLSPKEQKFIKNIGHKGKNQAGGTLLFCFITSFSIPFF